MKGAANDTKLAKNFWLSEFTDSRIASINGIDNTPPDNLMPWLLATATALQRTRDWLSEEAGKDCPILIDSGYRCYELNVRVGGGKGSHHMRASAVDWRCPSFGSPLEICRAMEPVMGELGWLQMIYEGTWVHSGILPVKSANRIISKTADGYAVGIIERSTA